MKVSWKNAFQHPWSAHVVVFGCLAFVAGGLLGCSQQRERTVQLSASADRITATNKSLGSRFSIAADEAKRVVRAIAAAKRDRNHYPAIFDGEIQFYAGTNLLTAIRFQDQILRCDSEQYSDDSGILKALYDRLTAEANAQGNP